MSGFFDRNFNLLTQKLTELEPDWINAEGVTIREAATKIPGAPTLLAGPDGAPLHSAYNPVRDAVVFANKMQAAPGENLFLIGFAAGYVAEALLERVGPEGSVTALELLPESLRAALDARNLETLFAAPNFRLFAGLPANAFRDLRAAAAAILESGRDYRFISYPPSLKILPLGLSEAADIATAFIGRVNPAYAFVEDREVFTLFDETQKKRVRNAPLDDDDRARLFTAGLFGDESMNYFAAPFEHATLPPSAQRILVVHLSSIGDVVVCAPSLAALRRRYPGARVCLLTEEPQAGLFRDGALVDAVFSYDRRELQARLHPYIQRKRLSELTVWFRDLAARLRMENFDLAINLHTSARSAVLASLPGAPAEFGFFSPDGGPHYLKSDFWNATKRFDADPAPMFLSAEYFLQTLRAPRDNESDPLRLSGKIRSAAVSKFRGGPGADSQPLVAINPGSNYAIRMWPEEYFAAIGKTLVEQMNARIIVTAGPAPADRQRAQRIADEIGPASVSAGEPLEVTAALYERCDLVITNDSGPMHLAGACGARTVVACAPAWNSPWGAAETISLRAELDCRGGDGCSGMGTCETGECMKALTPENVFAAAKFLLENETFTYGELAAHLKSALSPGIDARAVLPKPGLPRMSLPCAGRHPVENILVDAIEQIAIRNLFAASDAIAQGEKSDFSLDGLHGAPPPPAEVLQSLLDLLEDAPIDWDVFDVAVRDRASELRTAAMVMRAGEPLHPEHPARGVWLAFTPMGMSGFSTDELSAMFRYLCDFLLASSKTPQKN